PRQAEVDVLPRDRDLLDVAVPEHAEPLNRPLHELFRRRGARGEPDDLVLGDILRQLALAVDQLRSRPRVPRNLDEALRVRARLRADNENQRCLLSESLDSILAVLRGETGRA